MADRYRCVLLFGAPGVGKGTQGKRLGREDGYVHLATGDIFRALDPKSANGRKFLEYSSRGELVPDDLTVELWHAHVAKLIDTGAYRPATDVLLLDGIPRSLNQAKILDDLIEPLAVIHLTAPNLDEMVRRMKKRAEEQGRHDDEDVAVIRRRFEVYGEETAPVLHHFPDAIVHEVNALGTMDDVYARVFEAADRAVRCRGC